MSEKLTAKAETAKLHPNGPLTAEEGDTIDLFTVFQSLYREKKRVLVSSLVTLALATVIAFSITPLYTSSVSFIPPNANGNSSMAGALAGQLSMLGAGDLLGGVKNPGDLYAGILRSRSIAEELVKRFNLIKVYKAKRESEAENTLETNTAIAVDTKSSIVTVSVTAESPGTARDLANAFMDALQETDGRLALSQSSQRRLFFSQQLVKEKNDLEDAEVELKKTEEQSGLIAPTGQTESEIKTVADTQAQIALREVQLAALRQSATDQNSEVVRLRSEISDLQGQMSRLHRGGIGSESNATIPTSKVPQVQLDYIRKEREVKYHEALFDMLSRQYEAARLDEARDSPVLQVLDSASYPDRKSSPKRSLIMLSGLALGFIGSCVWALARGPLRTLRASLAQRGEA